MKTFPVFFSVIFFLLAVSANSQNVGIGTSTPHASAALEVQSTSKGMLVPRIALTAANVASPVSSPADALLVYNTATAGSGNDAVVPGFYYWNAASSRWTAIAGSTTNSSSVGFGTWGDCSMNNVGSYNPVGADDGAAVDAFGYSASISGNFAIITAAFDDVSTNADQGSAYVFFFNGSTWIQQQKLVASDGAAGDNFGISVSLSGNYAIIGSPYDDISTNADQGSAYIFFFNGSSWVQQQKLTAADGAADDNFGICVSISATKTIIGAGLDDAGASPTSNEGSAYVFNYNGSSWVQQQKLIAPDAAPGDYFGSSVSISGNNCIVGAYSDDIVANVEQGSAYVYIFIGSSWILLPKITASDGAGGDRFGWSVAISGNYAIISASFDNVGTYTHQGSAYIFFFNGSSWVEQQRITAADDGTNDEFGTIVSISGNYVMVSAHRDDIGVSTDQGSSYIFQNLNGTWIRLQKIISPTGNAGDLFGLPGIIDGNRFVIGGVGANNFKGMAFFGKIN
jgi:hypothetical protein